MPTVKVFLDPKEKILLKRKLGSDKAAQKHFTHEVRRHCDPYVPMRQGILKNTAIEQTSRIVYGQPYARRQYYEHKGNGQRGPHWDKRMWADHKDEILGEMAKYIGGHT